MCLTIVFNIHVLINIILLIPLKLTIIIINKSNNLQMWSKVTLTHTFIIIDIYNYTNK